MREFGESKTEVKNERRIEGRLLNILKRCILLLLLALCLLLVVVQRSTFYETREVYAINLFEKMVNVPEGETVFKQKFIAKQDELKEINIRFYIEDLVDLDGILYLQVFDKDGELVGERTKMLSSLVATENTDWTAFTFDNEMVRGEEYTMQLSIDRKSSGGKLKVYTASNNQGIFKGLTINDKKVKKHIIATYKFNGYCAGDYYRMLFLLGITALFVLLYGNRHFYRFLRRIRRSKAAGSFEKTKVGKALFNLDFLKKNRRKIFNDENLSKFLFVLAPFVAYDIVQTLGSYDFFSFLEQLFSVCGLINIILYTMILLLAYLLTNSRKLAAMLTTLLPYIMFLINYFVWNIRQCPIVAADFSSINTAKNVAGDYTYTMGLHACWATAILICFWCFLNMCKGYKGLHWKRRIAFLLVNAALVGGAYGVFFKTDTISDLGITVSVWQPERNYTTNGSLLSFIITWTYYIVDKPSGYSASKVEEITSKYVSDSASDDTSASNASASNTSDSKTDDSNTDGVKPNIIAIMNESFSDLAVDCPNLETSEDYMPFIHNLTENTVKGNLYVSVLGGNTANSEFEFLTGNSIAFFPSRSIPYNSYVKHKEASLTWTLKDQGYGGCNALHPYYPDGWNRPVVYPLLGFNNFYSKDDVVNPTYCRAFISDDSDVENLIMHYEEHESLKDDTPFYEFSVTMQNHGGYNGLHGLVDEDISVTYPSNPNDQLVQYINLIKKSDEAFQKLVEYFEKVDEPTVLVMYGDHQPGFTDSVFDQLVGTDATSLGIEDRSKLYQTPYIIWANYDIEEENLDMSANYLSSYLLKLTGNKMTGYNKYLLDMMKEIPVISALCYIGDDGVVHPIDQESEYSDKIHEYQMVQYNQVFDRKHTVDDFFYLKE